jgi:pimeloyl-ACP methyl ester carboxylesterase
MRNALILSTSIVAMATAQATPAAAKQQARNVVLVHGAVLDGSGWRAVHGFLASKGMRTTVVQLPLTSLEDDVATTRAAIARQDGPTVLVGSSYGGAVISVAGTDPNVASLVYVAALQPDTGESVADLNARWPMESHALDLGNGTMVVDPQWFHTEVAADLPEGDTSFMAASQRPTAFGIFTAKLPEIAWRDKPSFAVIATEDRTLDPDMLRFMYERSGASTIEIQAAHLPHISHPEAVADLILKAADGR